MNTHGEHCVVISVVKSMPMLIRGFLFQCAAESEVDALFSDVVLETKNAFPTIKQFNISILLVPSLL